MMNADPDFYIASSILVTVGVTWFVNPDKSTLNKFVYWLVVPVLDIAFMSLAFKSLAAGVGVGVIFLTLLAVGYLRNHFWH